MRSRASNRSQRGRERIDLDRVPFGDGFFAVESMIGMFPFDDPPCSAHQDGIPYSRRPIRFSTSLAPISVAA